VGFCGRGNEPLGSINDGEFLHELGSCKLLKENCSVELWLVC
jgi:hypothetical protein